jgi:hypothetical protein
LHILYQKVAQVIATFTCRGKESGFEVDAVWQERSDTIANSLDLGFT